MRQTHNANVKCYLKVLSYDAQITDGFQHSARVLLDFSLGSHQCEVMQSYSFVPKGLLARDAIQAALGSSICVR